MVRFKRLLNNKMLLIKSWSLDALLVNVIELLRFSIYGCKHCTIDLTRVNVEHYMIIYQYNIVFISQSGAEQLSHIKFLTKIQ